MASNEIGLTDIAYFDDSDFENLYNNHIGLRFAQLCSTHDALYGSKGSEVLVLILELYVDEYSSEAAQIEVIDDESCSVEPTEEFLASLLYFMNKFFSAEESEQFETISSSEFWGVPETIVVHIMTEHPETFEEQLGWAARFRRKDFPIDLNTFWEYGKFFKNAKDYNDEIVDRLVAKYGLDEE